jgi:septal ring factor EnvC (AmiA/AmiB activator)
MMKTRSERILKYITVCVALSSIFVASSVARDESDEDRDQQQKEQRYGLLDQEKQLLRKSDDISLEISETKRSIHELHKRLDALETSYSDVKHSLISVQLKLLK